MNGSSLFGNLPYKICETALLYLVCDFIEFIDDNEIVCSVSIVNITAVDQVGSRHSARDQISMNEDCCSGGLQGLFDFKELRIGFYSTLGMEWTCTGKMLVEELG